jgi:hypothetical protein
MWTLGDNMMELEAGGAAPPPPRRADPGAISKPSSSSHTSDMLHTLLQGQQEWYSHVAVLILTKLSSPHIVTLSKSAF